MDKNPYAYFPAKIGVYTDSHDYDKLTVSRKYAQEPFYPTALNKSLKGVWKN